MVATSQMSSLTPRIARISICHSRLVLATAPRCIVTPADIPHQALSAIDRGKGLRVSIDHRSRL